MDALPLIRLLPDYTSYRIINMAVRQLTALREHAHKVLVRAGVPVHFSCAHETIVKAMLSCLPVHAAKLTGVGASASGDVLAGVATGSHSAGARGSYLN